MALIRYLAVFFLIYFTIKVIIGFFRKRSTRSDPSDPEYINKNDQKRKKIIPKDEGEYVDFEEMDK